MPYYCARLLLVCLVDDQRPRKKNLCDHQFVLLRAESHEHAFQRALALGKQHETRYKNAKGQAVRWALVKVDRVTRIEGKLDGAEVGSVLDYMQTEEAVSYGKRFWPGRRKVEVA